MKALLEALKHYGTLEHTGSSSNPNITAWAKEVGVSGWYAGDHVPWCGLFVGVVMQRAGYKVNKDLLSSLAWQSWGEAVPKGREMLWDLLIFTRGNGFGHIGFYVGESDTAFLVFGGNQSNAVTFSWIAKSRHVATRRPIYKIGEPKNVRKIFLEKDGTLSENEQ
jgi:uncharacterized protein (TIGR02594 family)